MRSENNLNVQDITPVIPKLINSNDSKIVPIWFMRQAGRYLSEYRKVRATTNSFLEFCYTPEKAAEVTLQPIEIFDFDAAIIFSDILVIPDALGEHVSFKTGKGPVLEKITPENIEQLKFTPEKLSPVYNAIEIVRSRLALDKSLIGFAGAPWTIASYMIEGGSSKNFHDIKSWSYSDPLSFERLIYLLADSISEHLIKQIKSGVDVVQIFDSWASVVAEGKEFDRWIIKPTKYIIDRVKREYPNIPIIGFPKGAGISSLEYANNTGVDVIGVDYTLPIKWISENIDIAIQGNLDPVLLKSNLEIAVVKSEEILDAMHGRKFIFNLGHGILPQTPVDNVKTIVDLVKKVTN